MPTYRTPGVYVEEISTHPPSVAEVSTAIPAFLGYTERGAGVARINTLLEFEQRFGRARPSDFVVRTRPEDPPKHDGPRVVDAVVRDDSQRFHLYYSLNLYFKNGGGSCYIVSVGDYDATPAATDFEAGLALLEKEDEPTLIVLTDAVELASADYYAVCQQALAQCKKLGDRFTIVDVKDGDVDALRGVAGIGSNNLQYGAAYFPYVVTTLSHDYAESAVVVEDAGATAAKSVQSTLAFGAGGVVVRYTGAAADAPEAKLISGDASADLGFAVDGANRRLTVTNVGERKPADIVAAWTTWKTGNDPQGFDIAVDGAGDGAIDTLGMSFHKLVAPASKPPVSLASLKSGDHPETALYNSIRTALATERVVLPSSAAIAGVYAQVDRDRGVWKAPANVSLASVIGPTAKITHEEQERLNVDPTAGKSINAIRAFAGKGTLVWGARTLAGNDNEWRYVPVRRLFITIEESCQKATAFAVFEPNDATTWLKVKGMIESYLYGLWEKGGLAGSTPDAAYFVNVGLGKTMTAQDVLEGRMHIEVGIAAVRPAEFIVLRFSHKLQEA